MSGGLSWWANRKSRIGVTPSARKPPHTLNGGEWWTTPPTSCPQPEYIEYAATFMAELLAAKPRTPQQNRNKDAMLKYVSEWLRAARRLLHEEQQAPGRADLQTTDGIIVAASRAMQRMRSAIYGLGGEVDKDIEETMAATLGRAEKIRRERAIETSKRR